MVVRVIFILTILLIAVNGENTVDSNFSNQFQQGTEGLSKQRQPRSLLTAAAAGAKFIGKLIKKNNSQRGHGEITIDFDGSKTIKRKMFLLGNERNKLSFTELKTEPKNKTLNGTVGIGLEFENHGGHSLQLTGSHDPQGDLVEAAAKINLLNGFLHKLYANAFITRNMDSPSGTPDHNIFGVGIEYNFRDKSGHSWEISKTPMLQHTNITTKYKLNLFRGPHTSFDLSGGVTNSITPNKTSITRNPGKLSFTIRW